MIVRRPDPRAFPENLKSEEHWHGLSSDCCGSKAYGVQLDHYDPVLPSWDQSLTTMLFQRTDFLFVRRVWPLALMLCAERVPIESPHMEVR